LTHYAIEHPTDFRLGNPSGRRSELSAQPEVTTTKRGQAIVGDFHGLRSRTSNRALESSTIFEPVVIVALLAPLMP